MLMVEILLSKADVEILWKNKKFLAKGKRGFIYFSELRGEKFAIKTTNESSDALGTILKEAQNNKTLNKIGVGPKFYYYDEKRDFVIREFIEGERIFDWIELNKLGVGFRQNFWKIIDSILIQCRKMDGLGFNKYEMTNPHKDILITKDLRVFIIDFERCRFTNRPKNITQFCQFLVKGTMQQVLSKFDIYLDRESLLLLAENYKQEMNEENFVKLKEKIRKAFTQ